MAGGKGERFWPKSRANFPKQFLKLFGNRTMIQHTVDRILPLMPIGNVFIVTNENYKDIVKEQLPELPEENIIIEPVGRNTAPCIGLAAVHIKEKFTDSVMIVLPSDHMILNVVAFNNVLKNAASLAYKENALVTLGIEPDKPETGYGYIKFLVEENALGAYKVERFVEKPDKKTAEEYLRSGQYLWNSGMFIWKTEVILQEIQKHLPEVNNKLSKIGLSLYEGTYSQVLNEEFPYIQSISIDYGVMEKAENIYVYSSSFGWDDVGSWTAIERINNLDENNNCIVGNVINIDSKGCIVEGSNKLVVTIGLEDLIIVDSEDATLVCNKSHAQKVKDVLQILKGKGKVEYL
jgi:mannose-1-phosphate guanylyltransferase